MKRINPSGAVTRIWRTALFVTFAAFLGIKSTATNQQKAAGGLRLSVPVETPSGVHLSWTGGAADATYSIYRRAHHAGAQWERVALGLSGVSGAFFYPAFTLDMTYSYRIQAEAQE